MDRTELNLLARLDACFLALEEGLAARLGKGPLASMSRAERERLSEGVQDAIEEYAMADYDELDFEPASRWHRLLSDYANAEARLLRIVRKATSDLAPFELQAIAIEPEARASVH